GLDDQTLVGAPRRVVYGSLAALREPDAVIMDVNGFRYLWPDDPLDSAVGRVFEMNDHRAVIVGLGEASDTFQTFPILYTRYHQALQFVPQGRRFLSAILVHPEDGVDPHVVCRRIEAQTTQKAGRPGLKALTHQEFIWLTLGYFMRRTGIIVNFSITV